MDYKQAGVDIAEGDRAVDLIKPLAKSTFNQAVAGHIGGFGALYRLYPEQMRNPVLVSSTDGVGTKLLVAAMLQKYDTVGQCLVNHCVNDIFVQGAKPLFFLDYIACGKLNADNIAALVSGLATACRENNMALIGGETAEMPGLYRDEDFDLAGTIVGLAEEDRLLGSHRVKEGDVVLGWASTGLHTNGYSLARKVLFDKAGYRVDTYLPELGTTVGEALLQVHKSYYPLLAEHLDDIHALAHITGGGLAGNLKRSIPAGLCARVDTRVIETPAIFSLMQYLGGIDTPEMFRAFNMGVGMVGVVPAEKAVALAKNTGAWTLGLIEKGENPVELRY